MHRSRRRDWFVHRYCFTYKIIDFEISFTGSGKTTQIPQWAVDYTRSFGSKSVACTQPYAFFCVCKCDIYIYEIFNFLVAEWPQ
jgi:hypothetical protein